MGSELKFVGLAVFSLHYREPRLGRNPKTGEKVELAGKFVPHFKPGKELKDRVNLGMRLEHQADNRQLTDETAAQGLESSL